MHPSAEEKVGEKEGEKREKSIYLTSRTLWPFHNRQPVFGSPAIAILYNCCRDRVRKLISLDVYKASDIADFARDCVSVKNLNLFGIGARKSVDSNDANLLIIRLFELAIDRIKLQIFPTIPKDF